MPEYTSPANWASPPRWAGTRAMSDLTKAVGPSPRWRRWRAGPRLEVPVEELAGDGASSARAG